MTYALERKLVKFLPVFIIYSLLKGLQAEYLVENAFPNLSFTNPVGIYHANDNTNRLFILEQPGTIKVIDNNSTTDHVDIFLNITY